MNSNKTTWTIKYALLNISYFIAFCTIHAYAAVYLLAHGFTNTQVGILLAAANISSAVCQPLVAGLIDKPGPVTNRRFICFSVIVILAGSLLLMFAGDNKLLIFPVYAIIYMIQFTYQPVMTALCFEYQKSGCGIMYGLSRGLGSAGFAVTSAVIGGVVEKNGVSTLLYVNIAAMLISIVLIALFSKPKTGAGNASKADQKKAPEGSAHNNLLEFAKLYPSYTLFLLGTVCFFFAHNMINDFMIQIIRSLGGAETELGYANFLQAILELPVMAAMYISQSFQLLAYAVFIPAAAYYVNENMEELDQVKGQAFITTAITVGGIFSNFISGRILDSLGVRPMLSTGAVVCAIGVIISFIALNRRSTST